MVGEVKLYITVMKVVELIVDRIVAYRMIVRIIRPLVCLWTRGPGFTTHPRFHLSWFLRRGRSLSMGNILLCMARFVGLVHALYSKTDSIYLKLVILLRI